MNFSSSIQNKKFATRFHQKNKRSIKTKYFNRAESFISSFTQESHLNKCISICSLCTLRSRQFEIQTTICTSKSELAFNSNELSSLCGLWISKFIYAFIDWIFWITSDLFMNFLLKKIETEKPMQSLLICLNCENSKFLKSEGFPTKIAQSSKQNHEKSNKPNHCLSKTLSSYTVKIVDLSLNTEKLIYRLNTHITRAFKVLISL